MLTLPDLSCMQRTKIDLVRTGEGVDNEKDFCLERFISFARRVTDRLIAVGHWADYIDPCSGLSMVNKDSQQIYGEVDALVTLLNYQTTNTGCCKVVLHPAWGSAVYPASIFTKAPLTALHKALLETEAEIRAENFGAWNDDGILAPFSSTSTYWTSNRTDTVQAGVLNRYLYCRHAHYRCLHIV